MYSIERAERCMDKVNKIKVVQMTEEKKFTLH